MNKFKLLSLMFGLLVLILVFLFLVVKLLKPKMAGINISTSPSSKVLINNQEVAITPYRDFLKPGKYVLRLVPESSGEEIEPYDIEVNLEQGIETVIKRDFGLTNEESSGYLINFEKIEAGKTAISVISEPDFAEVSLDGTSRAITPYKTSAVLPGDHEIVVRLEGYLDSTFKVKTFKGYQLMANVKLSKVGVQTGENKATPTLSVTPTEAQLKDKGMGFIEVIDTPTGFLRVRSEPSTLGSEVGQAEPGKKYVLVGIDDKTGWYKIEYQVGTSESEAKAGWVSNQYAKKVE